MLLIGGWNFSDANCAEKQVKQFVNLYPNNKTSNKSNFNIEKFFPYKEKS